MDFELEGEELSSSLIITKDVDVFNWEALCLSSKLKTYVVNSKIDEVTLDILKTVDVLIVNISQLPKIHKIVN